MDRKEKLRAIVEGSVFTGIIQFLILASAIVFLIESDREQLEADPYKTYFAVLDIVFLLLFSIEYILRVYIEPRKRDFIFSFYGIVDFVAIVPSLFIVPGFGCFGCFGSCGSSGSSKRRGLSWRWIG